MSQRFNGPDYQQKRDGQRLAIQHERIKALMLDGKWRTLGQIAAGTGDPEASISAQLRHLRKPRFGGYTIEKRYVANGLFEYRLLDIGPLRFDDPKEGNME